MKANNAFKADDEAVSPVIGVILMVAITVVLAAVVFVLVTKLSSNQSEQTPDMSLQLNDATDRISVVSASPTADWDRLRISTGSAGTIKFALNGNAGLASTTVDADGEEIAAAADPMGAAEYIDLCGGTGQVVITIIDGASNQKIGDYTFSAVAACA